MLLKKLVLLITCLGHFLHALGIIVSNIKRFSVCFFIIYMSICMGKKSKYYICIPSSDTFD